MTRAILLTGTIDTSVFKNVTVILTDLNERLRQYSNTIKRYIEDSEFDKIVFVENSGYLFDENYFYDHALKYGKEFEYLPFVGNIENIISYGKSYGEAECITYGIKNSNLLRSEKYIYKVTGRVFLKNSTAICKTQHSCDNEFVVYNDTKWCHTNFFKVKREDYLTFLSDTEKECDDFNKKGIENVYYQRLLESKMDTRCFKIYPDLTGVIGGTGAQYDKKWFELYIRNVLCVIGYFNIKQTDAKLLSGLRMLKRLLIR
ncbi:hypothetical protein [Paenibacillus puerhi]|uniref:hypothetical protein n=1 Tax=Paenibacillus puerhi TaxID=2692622 RepID=UPI001357CDA4|nr:hypothetical protein [Paenibacillus puerhi]